MAKIFIGTPEDEILFEEDVASKKALAIALKLLKDMVEGMEDECRFLDIYQTENFGEAIVEVSNFPLKVRIEGIVLTQPHIGPYDLLLQQKMYKLGGGAPDC
tara:strand:+ start:36 stop:341 length:306 start_codon:yes stop_codon:yes gene_type:complete